MCVARPPGLLHASTPMHHACKNTQRMCPPQLWEEKKHHDGPVLNRRAVGSMGGMLLQILTARLACPASGDPPRRGRDTCACSTTAKTRRRSDASQLEHDRALMHGQVQHKYERRSMCTICTGSGHCAWRQRACSTRVSQEREETQESTGRRWHMTRTRASPGRQCTGND